jgi:hypothetical protein
MGAGMTRRPSDPSLAVTHPDIAAQLLIPQDPRVFTADSAESAWWQGPLGHVWSARVVDRVAGRGCPVCSSLQLPPLGRALTDVRPEAAEDADGWDPSLVSAGSRVEMPWRCHRCGTTWTAEIRARAKGHRSCPSCARGDHPSLTTTHPELASQMMAPFDPDDYTHGSKAKVRWRGPVGHEWDATVANRVKGSGCPVCARGAGARARKTPDLGASLADLYPEAAADADGWEPAEYRAKSSARLPWRCARCGHQWTATIFARTQRYGCPACAKARRSSE